MAPSQRIAAVHLWALPLERSFGLSLRALTWPCAVKRSVQGRTVLTHVNDAAKRAGVRPGMTAVEGKTRATELEIRDRDLAAERKLLESAAEALFALSDQVEVAGPDFIYVEIGRSQSALETIGLENEKAVAERIREMLGAFGHDVSVAIADDVDTARTLAAFRSATRPLPRKPRKKQPTDDARPARSKRRRIKKTKKADPQIVIAAPAGSGEALSSLPLDALLWTDGEVDPNGWLEVRLHSVQASLRVLGVTTIGQLSSFPVTQVKSRFGDAGALMMDRALGQLRRPLRVFAPPEKIVEVYDFEEPVEGLEPITFVIKRLLDRIEARLYARGRAAETVKLAFVTGPMRKRERAHVRLNRSTRSSRTMLRLCREKVSGALSGSVHRLEIEVAPVVDRGGQLDLFTVHEQRVEKVEELIDRLQASLGEQSVFAASLRNTHRPEAAWQGQPFEPERAFEEKSDKRSEKRAPRDVSALRRTLPRDQFPLPEANDDISVIAGTAVEGDGGVCVLSESRDPKLWPKSVERVAEDEPMSPLPPRPIELLEKPEPARLIDRRLHWRGQRLRVDDVEGRERLACEWWTSAPLRREYMVVTIEDGRRVWLFTDDDGRTYVHGVFD